jgi:hypothetical protein
MGPETSRTGTRFVGHVSGYARYVSDLEHDTGIPERAEPSDEGSAVEEVATGRSAATPFILLGSVALTIWLAAALAIGIALAVWWLA